MRRRDPATVERQEPVSGLSARARRRQTVTVMPTTSERRQRPGTIPRPTVLLAIASHEVAEILIDCAEHDPRLLDDRNRIEPRLRLIDPRLGLRVVDPHISSADLSVEPIDLAPRVINPIESLLIIGPHISSARLGVVVDDLHAGHAQGVHRLLIVDLHLGGRTRLHRVQRSENTLHLRLGDLIVRDRDDRVDSIWDHAVLPSKLTDLFLCQAVLFSQRIQLRPCLLVLGSCIAGGKGSPQEPVPEAHKLIAQFPGVRLRSIQTPVCPDQLLS